MSTTTTQMKIEIPNFSKMESSGFELVQCPCCQMVMQRGTYTHVRHMAAIKAANTKAGMKRFSAKSTSKGLNAQ